MALLFSESGTVWYDSVKGYYNPQTGVVYGADPPVGAWRGAGDPLYKAGIDQTNYGSTNANQQSSQQAATQVILSTCAALTDPNSSYLPICRSNNAPTPNLNKVSTNATQQTPTPGTSSLASSVSGLLSGNTGMLLIGAIVIGAMFMMGGDKHGYD